MAIVPNANVPPTSVSSVRTKTEAGGVDEFNTKLDEIQTEIENTEDNREK